MKVVQFPLARITFGFILGILAAFYLSPTPTITFGLLSISVFVFGISYFLQKKVIKNTLFFGLTTYFLSFLIGVTTQITHTDSYQKSNYTHYSSVFEEPHFFSIIIREKLKSTTVNDRYIALISHIDSKKCSGRIIFNVKKDSLAHPFETGAYLLINGTLYKNRQPNNPNQFDYSKYLEKKQIYAQLYSETNTIKIGADYKKDIWYYTSKLRTSIIHNLEKSGFNNRELNVAVALILGQKQDISSEIIQDYQYAGVIHILSVSGLHIGFILLLLTYILKPIPNTKKGALIKLIIILLSLSLFGVIAGLAASVVRSVTMFSFVAIGLHLRRSVNIYHTILVSALLILLFQPSFLFDVGFQLSYIALFSIIWFQPLLASIWHPNKTIQKYIWKTLTVSFAAQIGTLPLTIYYFHQFPGLFFITNLIVIPLMSYMMTLGILVMILAALGYAPHILVKLLESSIYFLNKIINWIASFEQFIIHDIPFNTYLLFSSYLFLIITIIWFKNPSFNKLALALISFIILQVSFIKTHWDIQNEQELVIFNIKKNTLITERNGKYVTVYTSTKNTESTKINSVLKPYLVGNFSIIKKEESIQNTTFFKTNKILILDSLGIYSKEMNPDILILTQSPKINLDRLLQTIKPKIIIADASNYKTMQKIWEASCQKQKILFHNTSEKGFYKLN